MGYTLRPDFDEVTNQAFSAQSTERLHNDFLPIHNVVSRASTVTSAHLYQRDRGNLNDVLVNVWRQLLTAYADTVGVNPFVEEEEQQPQPEPVRSGRRNQKEDTPEQSEE